MEARGFRRLVEWDVGLLAATYLLGVLTSLYVQVPSTESTAFWESAPSYILKAHILLGATTLVVSVLIALRSKGLGGPIRRNAVRGLGAVIVSFVAGFLFVLLGGNDICSLIMAIGFLGAIAAYASLEGYLRGSVSS